MSRPVRVPAYRKHRPSGQAVVTVTGLGGRPKDIYLGDQGSVESHREYARDRRVDRHRGRPGPPWRRTK